MAVWIDARIPVVFGAAADAGPDDAVLVFADDLAHPPSCACCVARGPAGAALGALFLRRARGEGAFFRRVVVVADAAGRAAIVDALATDPVAAARFRRD